MFAPVDYNDGATTGIAVNMALYGAAVWIVYASDAATQATWTFRESTASDLTGAQDLDVVTDTWKLTGTTEALLLTDDTPTHGTQTAGDVAAVDGSEEMYWGIIYANQMTDGYPWLSCNVDDPGAASIGFGVWLLTSARYAHEIQENVVS